MLVVVDVPDDSQGSYGIDIGRAVGLLPKTMDRSQSADCGSRLDANLEKSVGEAKRESPFTRGTSRTEFSDFVRQTAIQS